MGIGTLFGFTLIFPVAILTSSPGYWGISLIYLIYSIISGQFIIGLFLSVFLGLITYFLLKSIEKKINKFIIFKIISITLISLGFIIGLISFIPTHIYILKKDNLMKGHVWKVDTNSDKQTDKWVHDDPYGKLLYIEYDTNKDGTPDIREYYKDDKLISTLQINNNEKQ